jgi:hypothetical protein
MRKGRVAELKTAARAVSIIRFSKENKNALKMWKTPAFWVHLFWRYPAE